jgi:branched-chain amino acid transport system permease protein
MNVDATAIAATGRRIASPATRRMAYAVALLALAAVPFLGGSYATNAIAEVLIFAIWAMSLDLILGYAGLVSFGHAAFFGLGAYAAVILGVTYGVSAWIGLLAGVAAATVGATIIGYFCVRSTGVTFIMLTLAFNQLLYAVSLRWRELTGGSDGLGSLVRPTLFGASLFDPTRFYYLTLVVFVFAFAALKLIIRSPLGHVFVGLRGNDNRMRAIGYPTRTYKLIAFTIAGAFGGLSGAMYALFNGFISPESVYWTASGDVLIMVILGGAGTLVGPCIGAAVFLLMKTFASTQTEHWMLIIGTVFICCVMFFRKGLYGTALDLLRRRGLIE